MNTWTIVGIIVVGLGTLLVVKGQMVQSRHDSSSVEHKIDEIREELAKAKSASDSPVIDSIQSEFDAWAQDFLKTKDEQKLDLQRERLATLSSQLQLSSAARPLYQTFIDALRGAVAAYNSRSTHQIRAELSDLPGNLFDEARKEPYFGWIAFSDTVYWHVSLLSPNRPPIRNPPSLHIDLAVGKERISAGGEYIAVDAAANGRSVELWRQGTRMPAFFVAQSPAQIF
jgi:hypothetical protein